MYIKIVIITYMYVIISVNDISVQVTLPDRKVIKVTVAADDIVYAVVKRIKVNTKSNCEHIMIFIHLMITVCFDFLSKFHTCYLIIYAFVIILLCLLLIFLL